METFTDYLARVTGTRQWVVAAASTDRLRAKGLTLAIPRTRFHRHGVEHRASILARFAELSPVEQMAVALAFGGTGTNPTHQIPAAADIVAAGFTVVRKV